MIGTIIFENKQFTLEKVHIDHNVIRGWVRDGHWWMQYKDGVTTVHLVQPHLKTMFIPINWEAANNDITQQVGRFISFSISTVKQDQ